MNSLQVFDNFFSEAFSPLFHAKEAFNRPFFNQNQYSVYQKDGDYFVEMAVPGLSKDDISVNVDKEKRLLKVEGKKVEEEEKMEEEKVIWYHKGAMNQNFSLYLPKHLDLETVQAECSDGKLIVSFKVKDEEVLKQETMIEVPIMSNKA